MKELAMIAVDALNDIKQFTKCFLILESNLFIYSFLQE
jgi:hypothetical protein